jgi:hypothetical protein
MPNIPQAFTVNVLARKKNVDTSARVEHMVKKVGGVPFIERTLGRDISRTR